jgi:heterodisulfide reductase subunit A-like polyferredoxin
MKACTRRFIDRPLDIKSLGKLSMDLPAPAPAEQTGLKTAVIGGGAAGLSAAWQLAMKGHSVNLYEAGDRLGGKLRDSVTKGKLDRQVFEKDLGRIQSIGITIHTKHAVSDQDFKTILKDHDGVVVACGAQQKDGKGLHFLTPDIHHQNGKIKVTELGQTTDLKVFAAGDVVSRGLATHAIGQGRRCALALHALMTDQYYEPDTRTAIPYEQMKLTYFEFQRGEDFAVEKEADRCVSCGACRDCHVCATACYYGAISRQDLGGGEFEYVVDEDKCIGCGFCVGTCPSGVWQMTENL